MGTMGPILLEGVLFVALVAMAGALVAYGVFGHTGIGRWVRQVGNRRRIERLAERRRDTHCPVHGPSEERDLVRLPDGSRLCPACYAETFDVPHDRIQREP